MPHGKQEDLNEPDHSQPASKQETQWHSKPSSLPTFEKSSMVSIYQPLSYQLGHYRTIQTNHYMEIKGSRFASKKKLTIEKEEAVDPLYHLFTEIPLTSIERNPEYFFKGPSDGRRNQPSQQSPSLLSNRSLNQSSSVDSFQPLHLHRRRPSYQSRKRSWKDSMLKQTLKTQRAHYLLINFVEKIKRNVVNSRPVAESKLRVINQDKRKGWEVSDQLKMLWGVLVSVIIVILGLVQSLALAFSQLQGEDTFKLIIISGTVVMVGELGFGLLIARRQKGREISYLGDIFKSYLQGYLPVDGALLIILIVMLISFNSVVQKICLALLILKLTDLPGKLRPFNNYIVCHSKLGKYLPYIKLVMLNILIAHGTAILLNWMATAKDTSENWQSAKGIANAWWFQRYIWGFYWGVAMMTTMGFGDIVPVSYTEAIWVIFIEIACCLVLIYNITRIIQFLPMFNKKESQARTFEGFAGEQRIGDDLKGKVINYLQQKENSHDQFNVQAQTRVIKELPSQLKNEVLQQFFSPIQSLRYFNSLHHKTIHRLAQSIERKLYLPGQMIKPFDDLLDIYILEKGEVGFVCRSNYSELSNLVVDSVKNGHKYRLSLLSLDFITRERPIYQIRSTTSSVIIKIPYDCFKDALPASQKDFEFYCSLRDRSKHIPDEYQLVPCDNCYARHTKFTCPKLHFMPFKELVIMRHLKTLDGQNLRNSTPTSRLMHRKMNSLNIGKFCREEYAKAKEHQIYKGDVVKSNAVTLKRAKKDLNQVHSNSLQSVPQPSSSEADWASLLSLQLSNQLREQRMQDYTWLLNSDKIHDYREYFPEGNLSEVARRMSQASQRKREREI